MGTLTGAIKSSWDEEKIGKTFLAQKPVLSQVEGAQRAPSFGEIIKVFLRVLGAIKKWIVWFTRNVAKLKTLSCFEPLAREQLKQVVDEQGLPVFHG
jgi:hypothetical protein